MGLQCFLEGFKIKLRSDSCVAVMHSKQSVQRIGESPASVLVTSTQHAAHVCKLFMQFSLSSHHTAHLTAQVH